jgi:hypothetical protein
MVFGSGGLGMPFAKSAQGYSTTGLFFDYIPPPNQP